MLVSLPKTGSLPSASGSMVGSAFRMGLSVGLIEDQ